MEHPSGSYARQGQAAQKRVHRRMPFTRDFDETVKARARRDPEFREGLLNEAVGALVDSDAEICKALAAESSGTEAELIEHLEDQADASILRERLADGDVSAYIPHDQVVADVGG